MKKGLLCLSALSLFIAGCGNNASKKADNDCTCVTCKDSAELVMNISKKTKPESVSLYKELFEKCQAVTITEDGCLEYELFQSIKDTTDFMIFERWTSKQKQAEHLERQHVKEFFEATKDILEPTSGRIIESYICNCGV